MLTELIKKLLKTERQSIIKTEVGREYLYNDEKQGYTPVEDCRDHAPSLTLLDCASLIDWCKAVAAPGLVTIGRKDNTVAASPFWRAAHIPRDGTVKSFFLGYMPGERFDATLSYEDMLAWCDLLGERLIDADKIEAALKTVASVGGASVKAEQDGAIIRFRGETEAGVKLAAVLSKRIKARVPFGDPACAIDVEWSLQVTVGKDGAVSFRLRHLISDGAFDEYTHWMRAQLAMLPEGWLVVVGP
ncbi:MAG TPA: hypothetical protein DEB56_10050 [Thiobacillus sp.]|nr:hypothetical protein [Thiobacillus sp.]